MLTVALVKALLKLERENQQLQQQIAALQEDLEIAQELLSLMHGIDEIF